MALVSTTGNDAAVFSEVDMSSSDSSSTVRATVIQASTIFYDTPATLGSFHFLNRTPVLACMFSIVYVLCSLAFFR